MLGPILAFTAHRAHQKRAKADLMAQYRTTAAVSAQMARFYAKQGDSPAIARTHAVNARHYLWRFEELRRTYA